MRVSDCGTPKPTGSKVAGAKRRYLSPFERQQIHEACFQAAERWLDKCVTETRARILRGLHVRERGGFAIIEAIVPDPDAVAAALQDAGFEVKTEGMLILARRPLRARKRQASKEAS
jgi:hypothetical protein